MRVEALLLQDTPAKRLAGISKLSPFAASLMLSALCGRTVSHIHRVDPDEDGDDSDSVFWKRHRRLDNVLLDCLQHLPERMHLHSAVQNPNIVMIHINIHTSTICLHQTALEKTDRSSTGAPSNLIAESKQRCLIAAENVATLMRVIAPEVMAHVSSYNPVISVPTACHHELPLSTDLV